MHRPKGVEVTTWLMTASLVVSLVGIAFYWNSIGAIVIKPGSKMTPEGVRQFRNIAGLIGVLISGIFVFFYWKGRNWARSLVLLDSVFSLYEIVKFRTTWQTSVIYGVDLVLNFVLALFLIWYLFQKPVRDWFESRPGTNV